MHTTNKGEWNILFVCVRQLELFIILVIMYRGKGRREKEKKRASGAETGTPPLALLTIALTKD